MLSAKNVTVEGHDVYVNDYIVFPYALGCSEIMNDNSWVEEAKQYCSGIDTELLLELSKKKIKKVPKHGVINDVMTSLSEGLQAKASDEKTAFIIDQKSHQFLSDFTDLYCPHVERLTSRVIRLNNLIDMEAPATILTSEEKLCVKEAIVMLAIVKISCENNVNLDDCFEN